MDLVGLVLALVDSTRMHGSRLLPYLHDYPGQAPNLQWPAGLCWLRVGCNSGDTCNCGPMRPLDGSFD